MEWTVRALFLYFLWHGLAPFRLKNLSKFFVTQMWLFSLSHNCNSKFCCSVKVDIHVYTVNFMHNIKSVSLFFSKVFNYPVHSLNKAQCDQKIDISIYKCPSRFFFYNHVLFDCANHEENCLCTCIPCSRLMNTIRMRDFCVVYAFYKCIHSTCNCMSVESACWMLIWMFGYTS